jgi:F420-non-reducing hydrogenase iron-sulfur subunit
MASSPAKPAVPGKAENTGKIKAKVTVFHCLNVLNGALFPESNDYDIKSVKMPCSSMTREIFLLKAFEDGADAVVVLVCPEGTCRYMQGNTRAKKRVERIKKLLDEIGISGKRLHIYNVSHGDESAVEKIIQQTAADISILGPNPAA